MNKSFNDNMTDALLALIDATASNDDDSLDESIDDARTAFMQLTDDERIDLHEPFERMIELIQHDHMRLH